MNRKIFRKILFIILLVTLMSIVAVGVADHQSGDFIVDDFQGMLEVKEYTGTDEELFLPKIIDGKLCFFSRDAFSKTKTLKTIIIGGEHTGITSQLFENCTSLEKVILEDGVKYIHEDAFRGCKNLRSIQLPQTLESIEDYAFTGCSSLESISIPRKVTDIGNGAFSYCSKLVSVSLPHNNIRIGGWAFCGCSSLQSFVLPEDMTEIPEKMLEGCSSLNSISFPEGLRTIQKNAFSGCSSLGEVELPLTVYNLGENVFSDCSNLKLKATSQLVEFYAKENELQLTYDDYPELSAEDPQWERLLGKWKCTHLDELIEITETSFTEYNRKCPAFLGENDPISLAFNPAGNNIAVYDTKKGTYHYYEYHFDKEGQLQIGNSALFQSSDGTLNIGLSYDDEIPEDPRNTKTYLRYDGLVPEALEATSTVKPAVTPWTAPEPTLVPAMEDMENITLECDFGNTWLKRIRDDLYSGVNITFFRDGSAVLEEHETNGYFLCHGGWNFDGKTLTLDMVKETYVEHKIPYNQRLYCQYGELGFSLYPNETQLNFLKKYGNLNAEHLKDRVFIPCEPYMPTPPPLSEVNSTYQAEGDASGFSLPNGIRWGDSKETVRSLQSQGVEFSDTAEYMIEYLGVDFYGYDDGAIGYCFNDNHLLMAELTRYTPKGNYLEGIRGKLEDQYGAAIVLSEEEIFSCWQFFDTTLTDDDISIYGQPLTFETETGTDILFFQVLPPETENGDGVFCFIIYVSPEMKQRLREELKGNELPELTDFQPTQAPTEEAVEMETPEIIETPVDTTPPVQKTVDGFKAVISKTEADSYIVGKDPSAYAPDKMTDGIDETAWQFSTKNSKLKQTYAYFDFVSPIDVSALWIKNGFWKVTNGLDQYTRNSRVKELGIAFRYEGSDDWTDKMTVKLKDDKERQDWQKVDLGSHRKVVGIRFRIMSIYKGTKFPTDVCISEVAFITGN